MGTLVCKANASSNNSNREVVPHTNLDLQKETHLSLFFSWLQLHPLTCFTGVTGVTSTRRSQQYREIFDVSRVAFSTFFVCTLKVVKQITKRPTSKTLYYEQNSNQYNANVFSIMQNYSMVHVLSGNFPG